MNGITGYFLTKLDVLSGLDQVPDYEYFDGWWEEISKARTLNELPR